MLLSATIASSAAVHAAQGEKSPRTSRADALSTVGLPAPAFPYRYAGQVRREGLPAIVALIRDAQTYVVAAGDMIDGVYRLDRIGANDITVTYLPRKEQQTIALSSLRQEPAAAAPPAPVQQPLQQQPPATTPLGTQAPACC